MSHNNSNYTINSGMVTQMLTNSNPSSNTQYLNNYNNYSVGRETLAFDDEKKLLLSRNYDAYEPEYLVINLFPNQQPDVLTTVFRLCDKIRIFMAISDITVLQFSLSLLNELKPAILHDNKIYIPIPFHSLFGNRINSVGLYYSSVLFTIQDFIELSNYASSFSLITKVYLYSSSERNRFTSLGTNSLIQQIGSLHVSTPHYMSPNTVFQIQTNMFNGPTKGFFLQCCVENLVSIRFYINNNIRFSYDRFFIQTACVKVSNNLLYMPFNENNNFEDCSIGSYSGSINLTRLENSTIYLYFSSNQNKVVVHNVYFNYLRQSSGLAGLVVDYKPTFISRFRTDHDVPINGPSPNTSMLDMSGNYINTSTNTNTNTDMSGNYINHNNYSNYINNMSRRSWSNPDYIQNIVNNNSFTGSTGSSSFTGATASSVPTTNSNVNVSPPVYSIPLGNTSYRAIDQERSLCNITHEEILSDQRYMTCSSCNNNFSETSIKQWLSQHIGNRRTCPTCREVWINFDVYINELLLDVD